MNLGTILKGICASIVFKDSDFESTIDHYTSVHHQKQLKYKDLLYDETTDRFKNQTNHTMEIFLPAFNYSRKQYWFQMD